jgi:hypothetical protein
MPALFGEAEVEILLRLLRRIIQEITAPQGRTTRWMGSTFAFKAETWPDTAGLRDREP